MPHIEIQVMEGVFDDADKARIIKAVTKAFGDAAGGRMSGNTAIRILEIKSGSWGYGGQILTTEIGQRILAAKTDDA